MDITLSRTWFNFLDEYIARHCVGRKVQLFNSNEKQSPLKTKAGTKALPVAKNTWKIPS